MFYLFSNLTLCLPYVRTVCDFTSTNMCIPEVSPPFPICLLDAQANYSHRFQSNTRLLYFTQPIRKLNLVVLVCSSLPVIWNNLAMAEIQSIHPILPVELSGKWIGRLNWPNYLNWLDWVIAIIWKLHSLSNCLT